MLNREGSAQSLQPLQSPILEFWPWQTPSLQAVGSLLSEARSPRHTDAVAQATCFQARLNANEAPLTVPPIVEHLGVETDKVQGRRRHLPSHPYCSGAIRGSKS
jgi:hypothetical protein